VPRRCARTNAGGALGREAPDAATVASGAKIKPGEALPREALDAAEVPHPSTCRAGQGPRLCVSCDGSQSVAPRTGSLGNRLREKEMYYSPHLGKLWLERGGVVVIANIRGGGEFGPDWHRAGMRAGKKLAHDDFAAVARDLIARGVVSPPSAGTSAKTCILPSTPTSPIPRKPPYRP
jgi:hypothetical protein